MFRAASFPRLRANLVGPEQSGARSTAANVLVSVFEVVVGLAMGLLYLPIFIAVGFWLPLLALVASPIVAIVHFSDGQTEEGLLWALAIPAALSYFFLVEWLEKMRP